MTSGIIFAALRRTSGASSCEMVAVELRPGQRGFLGDDLAQACSAMAMMPERNLVIPDLRRLVPAPPLKAFHKLLRALAADARAAVGRGV